MGNQVSDASTLNAQRRNDIEPHGAQDPFPELPVKESPRRETEPWRDGPDTSKLIYKLGDRIMPAGFIKVHRTWRGIIGKVFQLPDGEADGSYGIDWDNGKHSRESGREIQPIPVDQESRPRTQSQPQRTNFQPARNGRFKRSSRDRKSREGSVDIDKLVQAGSSRVSRATSPVPQHQATPSVEIVEGVDEVEVEEEVDLTAKGSGAPARDERRDPEGGPALDPALSDGADSVESTPVDILDSAAGSDGPEIETPVIGELDEASDSAGPQSPLVRSQDSLDMVPAATALPNLPEEGSEPGTPQPGTPDAVEARPGRPSPKRSPSKWAFMGDGHSATIRGTYNHEAISHRVDDCREPGLYKIIRGAILRLTIEGDSQKVGGIKSGTIITVDQVVDTDGRLRGHVVKSKGVKDEGWMSLCADDGSVFWVEPFRTKSREREDLTTTPGATMGLPASSTQARRNNTSDTVDDGSDREDYGEGERIQIWSDRRGRWEDGKVLERLPSGRYEIQAAFSTVRMFPTRIRGSRKAGTIRTPPTAS